MSKNKFLQQLKAVGQLAESQQATIKKNRFVPDEVVRQLQTTGAFRLWVAKEYGGQQASVSDLMQAIQTVSYFNGSLGWILAVTGTAGLGSGYLKPASAQKIFGNTYSLTGGWAAPAGKAQKVEGGLVVNGKWSWGSGVRYCSHIVGGVMIYGEKEQRPVSGIVYLKPEEVELIDNWKVLGLHGTNSIDYQVKNVFVPDHRWIYFPVRQPIIDATLYRFSFLGALAAGVASAGLGLAQRAIDEIVMLSQSKIPNGARRSLAERPLIHHKVALIRAQYEAAKSFLEKAVLKNWEEAETGKISISAKSELRLAATYAVQQSVEVVKEAYTLGGGSSIWDGVKLQELLQDVMMVSQHGLVTPFNYEIAGRVRFGLGVNEWLL